MRMEIAVGGFHGQIWILVRSFATTVATKLFTDSGITTATATLVNPFVEMTKDTLIQIQIKTELSLGPTQFIKHYSDS